ncbi:hypothetical protein CBM2629_B90088 [Cupriavidus taiwanensis]|nr:hypothetical protein CBM2629_B90088 [Cupriavidus taiwanensis]
MRANLIINFFKSNLLLLTQYGDSLAQTTLYRLSSRRKVRYSPLR